jgi:hypothetical protein
MFFRAFLLDVTYQLTLTHVGTIADLAGHMNADGAFRHGFEAAFVPVSDPTADPLLPPSQFGGLPVRDFFPWDQVQDSTVVKDGGGLTFGDIIPPAPLGKLWDDISHFWQSRETAENDFDSAFVEIGLDDQEKVVEKINDHDHLKEILDKDHPIMKEVCGPRSCLGGERRRAVSPGVDGKSVSFGWIWLAFHEQALRERLPRAHDVPDDGYKKVKEFLETLNGTVPVRESRYEWYLVQYALGMNDDALFQRMVAEARTEALSWEDKKKPGGSSGERGPDPPAPTCADDQ